MGWKQLKWPQQATSSMLGAAILRPVMARVMMMVMLKMLGSMLARVSQHT